MGRNALLHARRARWDSPGVESGLRHSPANLPLQPAPGHCPCLPPSSRPGARCSAPSGGRSQSSSSPRCPQGFCPHLLQAIKGSHLITFPAYVVISLAGGMGRGRKGKLWSCAAWCRGQFALLGCTRLEITAGASPRQTAPGAGHHPRELCSQVSAGAKHCGCRVPGEGQSPHWEAGGATAQSTPGKKCLGAPQCWGSTPPKVCLVLEAGYLCRLG